MKSKEELRSIKERYEAVAKDLADATASDRKSKADELDATMKELSEDELREVTAAAFAIVMPAGPICEYVHNGCGGHIRNVGNPFASCFCDKCGETHYWHFSFDYTEEYTDQ